MKEIFWGGFLHQRKDSAIIHFNLHICCGLWFHDQRFSSTNLIDSIERCLDFKICLSPSANFILSEGASSYHHPVLGILPAISLSSFYSNQPPLSAVSGLLWEFISLSLKKDSRQSNDLPVESGAKTSVSFWMCFIPSNQNSFLLHYCFFWVDCSGIKPNDGHPHFIGTFSHIENSPNTSSALGINSELWIRLIC